MEVVSQRIKNSKTEDYTHKCNGRPFHKEKERYKSINITIAESTGNAFHDKLKNQEIFNTGNLVKYLYKLILK